MSTSGNTIATLNRDTIITAALRKLLVIGEGQAPTAEQTANGAEALNVIIAEFRTLGMQQFLRTTVSVPLVLNQSVYTWGAGLNINRPYAMYIYDIEYVEPTSGSKITLNQYAISDFQNLPIYAEGIPVNYNYQSLNNTGILSIWPTPVSFPTGAYMDVTYTRPMEVFNAGTDDYDCPQEWGNALIYGLALSLAEEYGVSDSKYSRLEKQAVSHLGMAVSASGEQGSIFFQPSAELTRSQW